MSQVRLFGTDGVRGVFGEPPLDPATIAALGDAVGARIGSPEHPATVVIGGDTRASTPRITEILNDALTGRGVCVRNAGVIPTPGVAWLVPHLSAAAGIVVSASHNPYTDNGIKLLSSRGGKLAADLERAIEDHTAGVSPEDSGAPSPGLSEPELTAAYRDHLVAQLPEAALRGLRLVVDTANGAAAPLAHEVFAACGGDVSVINDAPDGTNINRECGSTHPQRLQHEVLSRGADLGIAFDGDADRALLVDERGEVRDGDAILFLWALRLAAFGELDPPSIVATSMSNLGLEKALEKNGIGVVRCDVGDRAVVETLRSNGLRLGGEQSGHVVDLHASTTGDGLLTGLTIAAIVAGSGRPLSDLLSPLPRYPQLLVNVRVGARPAIEEVPELASAITDAEGALADEGRVVVRYSGTEPLLRIMIEGQDPDRVEELAGFLAETARRAIPIESQENAE